MRTNEDSTTMATVVRSLRHHTMKPHTKKCAVVEKVKCVDKGSEGVANQIEGPGRQGDQDIGGTLGKGTKQVEGGS